MTEDQIVKVTTHQVCKLHAQNQRFERVLRAIDVRLHTDTSPASLRQICRVIVKITSKNPKEVHA